MLRRQRRPRSDHLVRSDLVRLAAFLLGFVVVAVGVASSQPIPLVIFLTVAGACLMVWSTW